MKEKNSEEVLVGALIIGLVIFFTLITSSDFIKNSPKEANTIGQVIGLYFRNLLFSLTRG
jgi:hypothetical protein